MSRVDRHDISREITEVFKRHERHYAVEKEKGKKKLPRKQESFCSVEVSPFSSCLASSVGLFAIVTFLIWLHKLLKWPKSLGKESLIISKYQEKKALVLPQECQVQGVSFNMAIGK